MSDFSLRARFSPRRLTALVGLPCVSFLVFATGAQPISAQQSNIEPSTEQVSADSRGETSAAHTLYNRAKAAEDASNDREARDLYVSLLKSHPNMIEALHDLAYLQATSADSTVRNPKEAVTNASRVIDLAEKRMVQRRKIRGEENVLNPYNKIPLAASFYQVRMLNTLAVAYAAAGRFRSPLTSKAALRAAAGGCGVEAAARTLAAMALQAAQHTAVVHPSPENRQLLAFVEETSARINAGKAITGTRQPPPAGVSLQ